MGMVIMAKDSKETVDLWYLDREILDALCYFLIGNGTLKTPKSVSYFYSKPFKFRDEFEKWMKEGKAVRGNLYEVKEEKK